MATNAKASVFGRKLDEMIATMPPESQARIAERTAQLHAEVEGLKALRKLAQRSQEQIAQSLGVKQPAVVKIERQAISTSPPCAGSSRPPAARWNCGLNCPAPARSRSPGSARSTGPEA